MNYNRRSIQIPHGYVREPIPPPYTEQDPGESYYPPLPKRPNDLHDIPPALPPRPPVCQEAPPKLPPRASHSKRAIQQSGLECSRSESMYQLKFETNNLTTVTKTKMSAEITDTNIFSAAISTDAPLTSFTKVSHPVSLPSNTNNSGKPTQTNKFYGNMMLGTGTDPVWTHPYSIWYSTSTYYGMAVAHIKESQRVFDTTTTPPQYFFSPTGISSFVFSSTDFTSESDMSLGFYEIEQLSIQIQLMKSSTEFIVFPLIQGMGFVTAVYYNLIPKLNSLVGFKTITGDTSPRSGINKYKVVLENDVTWTLYVTVPSGQSLSLSLSNTNTIVGSQSVNGCVLQIIPDYSSEIDSAAGCYPTACNLTGAISGSTGTYTLDYTVDGSSNSGTTLMYALPHHYQNFTSAMDGKETSSVLDTTVCGQAKGYLTNEFIISVEVPSDLTFDPYTTISGKSSPSYSTSVLSAISTSATSEVTADVSSATNLDSMYYSGKILAKYAWVLYVCQYVLGNSDLVNTLLPKMKTAISRFTSNSQQLPLEYDQTWYGVISSGTSSEDFGNSYYNDHHFHYSYHVIAAAIVAKVDQDAGSGTWLSENRSWVEDLLRDYANPNASDPYFPVFRSFDWYVGHSWAKGLFTSGDGKDEESSSEDVNSAYAVKLWGIVTENSNLENVGNMMLGVLRTSLTNYFLYLDSNTIQPSAFIPNKVSGILFENKIDHTTYFGTLLQYIQMIHAIPITPASSFIRSPTFVQQEWEEKLAAIVDDVTDGWRGIMMLNVALYDPTTSYDFFNSSSFQTAYLDDGQSKTWSLTYSGAFI